MEAIRTVVHDLRLAARALARQKTWTTVATLTLALGIGANSALFTIVNAVLLRRLPYDNPDRIVSLSVETKTNDLGVVPSDVYRAWAANGRSFSSIATTFPDQMIDVGAGEPTLLSGYEVTASYFEVLGVAPEAGRVFTAAEDVKGGPPVIVLSDALWRSRFAGDRSILGKTVEIGEKQKIVIGVMPPSFSRTRRAMYWTPAALESSDPPGVTFFYTAIARLRDGASVRSASAELAAITTRVTAAKPTPSGLSAESPPEAYVPIVMTLHERSYGSARPALLILLAAVGVLLLIACANVSNLLLARAARRQREFAVRAAMGASRWRIVQYLLCESLLLCALGGALGLMIPPLIVGSLLKLSPAAVASVERVQVDTTVVAVTAAIVFTTSVLFALIPAFSATHGDPAAGLAGGVRTTSSARQHRLRGIIVVGELATALVLLTGAGLLGRSFVIATTVDPGFRAEHLYALRLGLPRARYPDERASVFFRTLLQRARAVRGVRSAALADLTPLAGVPASTRLVDARQRVLVFDDAGVGPGYFETVGVRPTAGRVFDTAEPPSAGRVVISESMARTAFPGQDPVGQSLGLGPTAATIIGVVPDMRQHGLERPTLPLVYRQLLDTGGTSLGSRATLLVRTDDPKPTAAAIRAIVRDIDPRVLPPDMRSMDDIIGQAAAPRKFNSLVLGSFALLAAFLAAIGLYGVLAYLVSDRMHEIGIRIALGADQGRVLRLIMRQGSTMLAVGLALGLLGSIAAVRLLRGLLFGVGVYDPSTFVAAAATLAGAALLACYLPARRATRVDPMIALRAE